MGNLIEFRIDLIADLELSPKHRLERVRLRRGTQVQVCIVPRVVETVMGPIETGDLHFADGSIVRHVRYENFRFVD
jgi:hypothetical protein